jgi:hypothetical protein
MTQEATTTAPTTEVPAAQTDVAATDAVARRCPWCSEVLPAGEAVRCPHCYANLVPEGEPHVPGLTEVEAPTAAKVRRAESPKRGKLFSWISGEVSDEPMASEAAIAAEAVAPPARDVRREMLRLQLEAEGIAVSEDGVISMPTEAKTAETAPETSETEAAPTDVGAPDAAESPELIRKAS